MPTMVWYRTMKWCQLWCICIWSGTVKPHHSLHVFSFQ